MTEVPRLIRPVGPPLGVYLRPGRNDHTAVLDFIGLEPEVLAGVIFDPCLDQRQQELRQEVTRSRLDAVLDPKSVELATETGFTREALTKLPWASSEPDTPGSLTGSGADRAAGALAGFAVEKGFSSVLAPTHYLSSSEDPWLLTDLALTRRLRSELDAGGATEVPIYYPLVIHSALFRDAAERARIIAALQNMPIDALWLRIHPFGSTSGRTALRRYIEACQDFHRLALPLVAERTGTIGVALLAFGAVGGIESGITFGESFDMAPLLRPPKPGSGFLPPPRIYLTDLGAFLPRAQAEKLFENRQMKAALGCRDTRCCHHGTADTLREPRQHFLRQRLAQVQRLSRAPQTLRPQLYLDEFLRPATDLALRAAKVEPALETTRKRLEGWRHTLGGLARTQPITTVASVPEGRRLKTRKRA